MDTPSDPAHRPPSSFPHEASGESATAGRGAGPDAAGDPGRLTLHVRLTKRCNADCSYCSSWQDAPRAYMPFEDFRRALAFVQAQVLPLMGFPAVEAGQRSPHVTVQYVGGEILTVPDAVLRRIVFHARDALSAQFEDVIDGVQSNLIASEAKVRRLHSLFGERLGTSVDHFTPQRTVAGSPAKYRDILARSRAQLKARRGFVPPAIFVVDRQGLPHVAQEIALAEAQGYALTLRPAFDGGRTVDHALRDGIIAELSSLAEHWLMRGRVLVEPFYHLTASRLAHRSAGAVPAGMLACPFQKTCARVSLDLEPNGDLFVCLDMADSDQARLGNALTGDFDTDLWRSLAARAEHYDSSCRACTWLAECQGGCMSEALHHTGNPYGKTELCGLWKGIFAAADRAIDHHGGAAVRTWLSGLTRRGPQREAAE